MWNISQKWVNSIRNKFILTESIFPIAEQKVDSAFPMNQFRILRYKIFRHVHNRLEGGLLSYINENILCRPPSGYLTFFDLELIVVKIHQKKLIWLSLSIYKPPSQSDIEFTNTVIWKLNSTWRF